MNEPKEPIYTLSHGEGAIRVVAMFTVGTSYEAEAGKFIASLLDHDQPFYIEALPKSEDWDAAVAQKPHVIDRALMKFNTPILFVDVDAWFHRPVLNEAMAIAMECDFAAHWFQGPDGGFHPRNDDKMLSGTMIWRPTFEAFKLLYRWKALNYEKKDGGGQVNLEAVLHEDPRLKIFRLPGRWTRVYNKPQFYPDNEPVWIEHSCASRENRGNSKGATYPGRKEFIDSLVPEFQPEFIIAPNRGEFGLKCCYHAPAVHAIDGPKLVFHEPGEEVLYPSATRRVLVSPQDDHERRGMVDRSKVVPISLKDISRAAWPDSKWVVTNDVMLRQPVPMPVSDHAPVYDVVVCPRKRAYGAEKNWRYWPDLVDRLIAEGLSVFAAGVEATSFTTNAVSAWDQPNPLIASINALQNARSVVATDNGLAHLALMCRPEIMMIVDGEDRVSPGYWPVITDRFTQFGGRIDFISNSWYTPELVSARVVEAVGTPVLA